MSVVDVSSRLGEYMLKGWVLTDTPCTTRSCRVPLMRSPNGVTPVIHFCANCDENPDASRSRSETASSNSTSSSSRLSIVRPDTPPTELSSELSSPTFALPPETPESIRRREQSDRASTEIGNRLLKGWAMLADECPNDQCFGVPLVRPPKAGGEKDNSLKECVICAGVYTTERDWAGRERLVVVPTEPASSANATDGSNPDTTPVPSAVIQPNVIKKEPSAVASSSQSAHRTSLGRPTIDMQSSNSPLENSASALGNTLVSLSRRLDTLTNPALGFVDLNSISLLAESISKTTQALSQVRELQWIEKQRAANRAS